jgi:DNA transformation protein
MDLVEHTLELFAPLGAARAKRMFGGWGFYVDDLFIALVAFDRLYLKADADTEAAYRAAGSGPFVYDGGAKPVTMSYWAAPPEAMESPAAMAPWAQRAIAAALRARALSKPRKAAAKRSTPGAAPKPAAPAKPRPRARAKRR